MRREPKDEPGVGHQGALSPLLGLHLSVDSGTILLGLVRRGGAKPVGADDREGEDAEASFVGAVELLPATGDERRERGLQQPHLVDQIGSPRLSSVRQLPSQNPVLLRET